MTLMPTHFLVQTLPPQEPHQLSKLCKSGVLPVNEIRFKLAFFFQITFQIVEVHMKLIGVLAL